MILANIAGQMAYSTLSLYMIDLGASISQVGLAFTLASLVPMVLQIFGGWLSDTIGRLRVIAFGSSIAVFGYFIFSIAPGWEWVLLGLSIEYVSNSMVGPSFNAYIAEQSDETQRGRVFGLTSSIFMTVTVIGPALAGFLAFKSGFRPMLSVAFGFYLAATLLRLWMATREHFEKRNAEKPTFDGFKTQISAVFTLLFAGGILTWIWVTDAVGDTSYNLIGELFPIYLSKIGHLDLSQIGLVNSARGVAIIAMSFAAGWLVDKISERAVIVGGFLLQGLGILSVLFAESFAGFILSMLIFGVGTAGLLPAYDSLISKVVPESKRGLAFGLFGTTLGILSLPMPWIGAQLWERFSPQVPFWFSVIACLISIPIAWFKFVVRDDEPAEVAETTNITPLS
jgi:MFS family permease